MYKPQATGLQKLLRVPWVCSTSVTHRALLPGMGSSGAQRKVSLPQAGMSLENQWTSGWSFGLEAGWTWVQSAASHQ